MGTNEEDGFVRTAPRRGDVGDGEWVGFVWDLLECGGGDEAG